eukprot:TRINITY_DN17564_c0_g2_i1.p1 TRINITY_DN17564_c0_g2~~TRINITY_DN17564_c0_g2_i1.p1  ORF type:complete len:577 (+),score=119.35 TRINITY_DN17564_c0_g2_i1:148-1878(+)
MRVIAGSYERYLFGFSLSPPASGLGGEGAHALASDPPGESVGGQEDEAARRNGERKEDESEEEDAGTEGRSLGRAGSGRTQRPQGTERTEIGRLPLLFSYGAHLGPVKSLAVSGQVAVSGGADDVIKIYDLKSSADMGSLMQHQGAVTALQFHGPQGHPTHLLSGGEDSKVCIWDADTWQHLKTLNGHRGAVNDLSIHPSGRLALSVSRDNTLRMWSLLHGKSPFHSRLPQEGHLVSFAPGEGASYALVQGGGPGDGGDVALHQSEDGKEIRKLTHGGRVLSMVHHSENLAVTAGEESTIRVWHADTPEPILTVESAHKTRIKAVATASLAGDGSAEEHSLPSLIASASSDGVVRVWDPRMIRRKKGASGGAEEGGVPLPLFEAETRARLTCLSIGGVSGPPLKKTAELGGARAPDKKGGIKTAETEGIRSSSLSSGARAGERGKVRKASKENGNDDVTLNALRERKLHGDGRVDAGDEGRVKKKRQVSGLALGERSGSAKKAKGVLASKGGDWSHVVKRKERLDDSEVRKEGGKKARQVEGKGEVRRATKVGRGSSGSKGRKADDSLVSIPVKRG